MAKVILIKPVISEKSEMLSEKNQYTFIVDKTATKFDIKREVKFKYDVNVTSVNTMIMPHKAKSRNTRSRVILGRVPSFKKAVVTVADGDVIDFYGEI